MPESKKQTIALVAHDNKKNDLVNWCRHHHGLLSNYALCATGTTGKLISEKADLEIKRLQSGPLGGDLQLGALIAEDKIDFLIFFWDPLEAQPHDPDIKALLRIAAVWNIPVACNRASADFIFTSSLLNEPYKRQHPDYTDHNERSLDG